MGLTMGFTTRFEGSMVTYGHQWPCPHPLLHIATSADAPPLSRITGIAQLQRDRLAGPQGVHSAGCDLKILNCQHLNNTNMLFFWLPLFNNGY